VNRRRDISRKLQFHLPSSEGSDMLQFHLPSSEGSDMLQFHLPSCEGIVQAHKVNRLRLCQNRSDCRLTSRLRMCTEGGVHKQRIMHASLMEVHLPSKRETMVSICLFLVFHFVACIFLNVSFPRNFFYFFPTFFLFLFLYFSFQPSACNIFSFM